MTAEPLFTRAELAEQEAAKGTYVVNSDYDGPAEFVHLSRALESANDLNARHGQYYRFTPKFVYGRYLISQTSRKIESTATTAIRQGTGHESCQRVAELDCEGGNTRYYGERLPDNGFTGWRGPFCSAHCYRMSHPSEPIPVSQSA